METIYIDFLEEAGWDEDMLVCETCGHYAQETLSAYEDMDNEGIIFADYTCEVSCYGGNSFYGTLDEFKEWYVDNVVGGEEKQLIEEALKDLW